MGQCPNCANKKIIKWSEEAITVIRSVATGKVLKREKSGYATCWGFYCKCGWKSGTFTE